LISSSPICSGYRILVGKYASTITYLSRNAEVIIFCSTNIFSTICFSSAISSKIMNVQQKEFYVTNALNSD
jgi:hypothetical protein